MLALPSANTPALNFVLPAFREWLALGINLFLFCLKILQEAGYNQLGLSNWCVCVCVCVFLCVRACARERAWHVCVCVCMCVCVYVHAVSSSPLPHLLFRIQMTQSAHGRSCEWCCFTYCLFCSSELFCPTSEPTVVQEALSQASANRDPGLRLKLGCICRSPGRSTPFFQAVPRSNHRIYVKKCLFGDGGAEVIHEFRD